MDFLAHKKKINKQPKKSSKSKARPALGGPFALNVSLRVVKSLLLGLIVVLFLGGMLVVGIGAGYFAHLVEGTPTPTKSEMKQKVGDIAESSKLLYADNQELATIQADPIREK